MSTYYEACEPETGIVIRAGTFEQMLGYVEACQFTLYRRTRRGHRYQMRPIERGSEVWVADDDCSCERCRKEKP
jgi:hypothetical protein